MSVLPPRFRSVARVVEPEPVMEGAGVRLRRSVATATLDHVDPFLLFDHFGSSDPRDYVAGFPMHPHRGIETVTYMLDGRVSHRDSLGNHGAIGPGDVQWMTAGSGILHEEMPEATPRLDGFQVWVNLPASHKMTRPRYQDVPSGRIPEVARPDGVRVRVIAGTVDGVPGAVKEIVAEPEYLDVTMPAGTTFVQPVPAGHTAIAYLFEGEVEVGDPAAGPGHALSATRLAILGDGDVAGFRTGRSAVRFLLLSGKPIREPMARYGPFVMNTPAEIDQALRDLRGGTFVKR